MANDGGCNGVAVVERKKERERNTNNKTTTSFSDSIQLLINDGRHSMMRIDVVVNLREQCVCVFIVGLFGNDETHYFSYIWFIMNHDDAIIVFEQQ